MLNLDTKKIYMKEEEGCLFWSGGQEDSLVDLRRGRHAFFFSGPFLCVCVCVNTCGDALLSK